MKSYSFQVGGHEKDERLHGSGGGEEDLISSEAHPYEDHYLE